MTSIIGVDLGGTKIAAVRYDAASRQSQATQRLGTQAEKPFEEIIALLLATIEKLKTKDTRAIGIGVPGLIRRPQGTILTLPNIPGAEDYPLQERIAEETGLSVIVENDSSCFTLAEALHGAGKGQKIVVGITMGTGVGGGIVIEEKLFHGSAGFAAEFGHMLLKPGEAPRGMAEGRGAIEEYLSGTALKKRCPAAAKPEDILSGPSCAALHPAIIQEVAWMCANLTHCIDPTIIVFGGAAGRALHPHLPAIAQGLRQWLLPKMPAPALAIGALDDAGTLGAALLTS